MAWPVRAFRRGTLRTAALGGVRWRALIRMCAFAWQVEYKLEQQQLRAEARRALRQSLEDELYDKAQAQAMLQLFHLLGAVVCYPLSARVIPFVLLRPTGA